MDAVVDAYLNGSRGVVCSVSPDGGSPMVLTLETIETAAQDPRSIGQLMTDMALAEGKNLEGCALYFEHRDEPGQQLAEYATGLESSTTGGWVRCITSPIQLNREQGQLARAAAAGRVTMHGKHRGVLLVQFHAKPARGFGRGVV